MAHYTDGQLIGFAIAVAATGFAALWGAVNAVFDAHDRLNGVRPDHRRAR